MFQMGETIRDNYHKLRSYLLPFIAVAMLVLAACGGSGSGGENTPIRAGGDTSVDNRTSFAFEEPAANLSPESLAKHMEGDIKFGDVFVTPPSPRNAGLGPLFNNVSCDSCHIKNGRGLPVFGNTGLRSLALVRVSDPNGTPTVPGGNPPVEGLGNQI